MDDIFKKKWSDTLIDYNKNTTMNGIAAISDLITALQNSPNEYLANLRNNARNLVFSSGPIDSPVMIIGEAPGEKEDESALPFVGDSGKLLNKMLAAIDVNRDKTYVTNVVLWRPEKNRQPTDEEIAAFRPFLYKHIQLKKPKIILVLGSIAMKALNISGNITSARGTIYIHDGIHVILSFHPSYLLRFSPAKIMALDDFKLLESKLHEMGINLH
jgi:uracil-DNA glycosylase family 4